MISKQKFVENVERRKWDLEEYERKAREQIEVEEREALRKKKTAVVKTTALQVRDNQVDLTSKIGKFQVITNNTPLEQRGGFYCDVCECLLKDSHTYLDHINGRKHQKALGMNMKVERSTLTQVRERLAYHKQQKEEKSHVQADQAITDLEKRLREQVEGGKRKKKRKTQDDKDQDVEKNQEDQDNEDREDREDREDNEDSEHPSSTNNSSKGSAPPGIRHKEEPSSSKQSEQNNATQSKTGQDDSTNKSEAAMMAAMGFGSFGGSKKH